MVIRLFLTLAFATLVGCGINAGKAALGTATNSPAADRENQGAGATLPLGPLASAGPDLVVRRGTVVRLDARASRHPLDQTLSFRWTQTEGDAAVTLSNPSSAQASFIAPATTTTLKFKLRAQVSVSSFQDDEVAVYVTDTPGGTSPVLIAPHDVDVVANATTTVSTRLIGSSTALTFTIVAGPIVALTAKSDTSVAFTAPASLAVLAAQGTIDGLDTGPVFSVLRLPFVAPQSDSTDSTKGSTGGTSGGGAAAPSNAAAPTAFDAFDVMSVAPGERVSLERAVHGTWRQVSGPQVDLVEETITKSHFDAPALLSQLAFLFTPDSDATGDPDIQVYQVHEALLDASTLDAGSDLVTHPGNVVRLNGAGSTPASPSVIPVWEQTLGTDVTPLLDSATLEPSFTAPSEVSELCFALRWRLASGAAETAPDSVVVRVRPTSVNDAPTSVLTSGETTSQVYALSATDTDPERDGITSREWSTTVAGVVIETPLEASTSIDTTTAASRPIPVHYEVCDALSACATFTIDLP